MLSGVLSLFIFLQGPDFSLSFRWHNFYSSSHLLILSSAAQIYLWTSEIFHFDCCSWLQNLIFFSFFLLLIADEMSSFLPVVLGCGLLVQWPYSQWLPWSLYWAQHVGPSKAASVAGSHFPDIFHMLYWLVLKTGHFSTQAVGLFARLWWTLWNLFHFQQCPAFELPTHLLFLVLSFSLATWVSRGHLLARVVLKSGCIYLAQRCCHSSGTFLTLL